jgi:acyl-CoA thioesterase FadM
VSAEVLTTWGVVLNLAPEATPAGGDDRATVRWFALAREAYFARCPRLGALLDAEPALLRVTAEHVDSIGEGQGAGGVRVGVSVVEVRPTSFDMAVRIRVAGSHAAGAVNGRCTLALERRATGERLRIPPGIRDEFVAIQLAARDLC